MGSTNEIPSTSQQALDGLGRTVDKIQVIHRLVKISSEFFFSGEEI